MSSESVRAEAGRREPIKVQERGYNPPPVAKVQRPKPTAPAPRPSAPAHAPRERS